METTQSVGATRLNRCTIRLPVCPFGAVDGRDVADHRAAVGRGGSPPPTLAPPVPPVTWSSPGARLRL